MTIQDFQETIMHIRPSNFMALGGAASGIVGSSNSGSVAVQQLQRATITFVQAYRDNDNEEQLLAAHKEVLAGIMVSLTMDAITEERADELVDALQQLMKERKKS